MKKSKIKRYEYTDDDPTDVSVSSYTVTDPDGYYAFTISHIKGWDLGEYVGKIVNFLTESREEVEGEYKKQLTEKGFCLNVTNGRIFLFCPYVNEETYFLHTDVESTNESEDSTLVIVPRSGIILPKGKYFKLILSNGIYYNFLEGFDDEVLDMGRDKRNANIFNHYVLN